MFRRTMLIPGLICLGLMAPGHYAVADGAIAQGTKVVTVRATPIKNGEAVVTEAAAGRIFTVREVRGNWLLVTVEDAGRTSKGFLYVPHAISLTEAIARLTEQIERGQGNAETYFDVGLFRYHLGRWDEAITAFSEAIGLRSDWARPHALRGCTWLAKQDFSRAIPDYDRAIELDGSVANYYIDRGRAWQGMGDLDKALTDFTEAIQLAPNDPVAYVDRGDAWRRKRKFDKAIVDLDQAFRLRIGYAPAFDVRGWVYYDQGKYREAIADLGVAIDQDPASADAYVGRANAWYAIHEFDRAIADWKDAQRLRAKRYSLHLELGNACWTQGDCGQAIAAYTAAIQADQTNVAAYRYRADCYEMAGEQSKAEADRVTAAVVESGLLVGASLRLASEEFVALLRDQLKTRDLVLIRGLQPLSGRDVIFHLTEYSPDSATHSLQPSRIWQTRLAPGGQWAALAESLVSAASSLREAGAWVVELPGLGRSRYVELLYQIPQQDQLVFPGLPDVVFSEEAQRHLCLCQRSSYPATRNVLILDEPHQDLQQHRNPVRGLEVLFADNPSLATSGRCVFLSEAWPAGQPLSIAPLRLAQPSPTEPLVRRVLESYLVPASIAFLWQQSLDVPILGTEDLVLHRLSNRLHADLWSGLNQGGRIDGSRNLHVYRLRGITVAARNKAIAGAVIAATEQYELPFLFVGSGHVGPYAASQEYPAGYWEQFRGLISDEELELVRHTSADRRGIAEFLMERGIGFYLLCPRSAAFRDRGRERGWGERYVQLRRAQTGGDLNGYVASLADRRGGCTVMPAPEAAARLIAALMQPPPPSPPLDPPASTDSEKPRDPPKQSAAEQTAQPLVAAKKQPPRRPKDSGDDEEESVAAGASPPPPPPPPAAPKSQDEEDEEDEDEEKDDDEEDSNELTELLAQLEAAQNGPAGNAAQDVIVRPDKDLTIVVTDFGICHWRDWLRMFADFTSAAAASVVPGLSRQGEILVVMPDDEDFPKTDREKRELVLRIAAGIIARIERSGLRTYEVRLVQNINKKGYFAPWRQAKIKQFGRIAYQALALVKKHFEKQGKSVYMPAIAGSNGGFMLTETLPLLDDNPIDCAVLVDARAHAPATKRTSEALNGRLAIINTAGDAPALTYNQAPIPVGMVANHDEAKKLKASLPELRLFWVDAEGSAVLGISTEPVDVFVSQHLATMRQSNPSIVAKEFNGLGYGPKAEMTAWDLLSELIDVQPGETRLIPLSEEH